MTMTFDQKKRAIEILHKLWCDERNLVAPTLVIEEGKEKFEECEGR